MNSVSFFAAFSSLLYELIFAQILSIYLGGTVLRYASIVGIYTLCLGVGNLFYGHFLKASKRLFLWIEVLLFLLGLGLPLLFLKFPECPESLLYAAPICIGLLSGLELPLIFDYCENRKKENQALAWDYLGMLLAAVLFPTFLLPQLGLQKSVFIAAGCNFFLFFLLYFKKLNAKNFSLENKEASSLNKVPLNLQIILCTFIFSFCSLAYELVLAKTVGEFIHNETLAQCLSIGFFLAGLGAGTFHWSLKKNKENAWNYLFKIEIALALWGSIASLLCLSLGTLFLLRYPQLNQALTAALLLQPLIFLVGYLSGFEIPLTLEMIKKSKINNSLILACSCFGGLVASFVIPTFLFSRFSPAAIGIMIAFGNLLGLFILIFFFNRFFSIQKLLFLLIPAFFIFIAARFHHDIEQLFLKTHYLRFKINHLSYQEIKSFWKNVSQMGDIQRYRSPYQTLDIIDVTTIRSPVLVDDYTLYLNRQPQFSRSSWKTYHESMSHGAIHLAQKTPHNVLILGGGDGILAGQLLEYSEIKKITLVDIDPKIIELAKSEKEILKLNHYSFFNSRVEVKNEDALRFVQKTSEKYDAVFVDFPYPFDLETSKLYSIEFYSDLIHIIAEDGFAILDAPLWKYLDENLAKDPLIHRKLIMNTLRAAGFETIFPFGSLEALIYLTPKKTNPVFNYDKLSSRFSNRSFVNLVPIDIEIPAKPDKAWINSRFRPRDFN